MLLSTSSSDPRALPAYGFESTAWQRAPHGAGRWTVLFIFAVFVITVGLAEAGWRLMGINETSVSDDMRLWSIQRDIIGDGRNSQNIVALLGGSRMQLGFSSEVFREMFPDRKLVKLAISGSKPMAALRDLAENTEFNGVAIVAVYTLALTAKSLYDQQPYVDYYHKNWTLDAFLNREIKTFLEMHLVSMNPRVKTKDVVRYLMDDGSKLKGHYLRITADRSFYADYSKVNPDVLRERKEERVKRLSKKAEVPVTSEQWLKRTQRMEDYARQIIARGGRVVFVRFPVDYEDWKVTHGRIYPNEEYWDVSAAHSQATFIHFSDYSQLHFSSPDGSHLDKRDAKIFTRNLLELLDKKGIFRP